MIFFYLTAICAGALIAGAVVYSQREKIRNFFSFCKRSVVKILKINKKKGTVSVSISEEIARELKNKNYRVKNIGLFRVKKAVDIPVDDADYEEDIREGETIEVGC